MKILVVDDERDVQALFEQRFRKETREKKVELVFAFSAQDALNYLDEFAHETPHVLSDINMPGMSGLELLKSIKQQYKQPAPSVMMITAYGDADNFNAAKNLGADDFLTKPVDFALLKGKLNIWLNALKSGIGSNLSIFAAAKAPSMFKVFAFQISDSIDIKSFKTAFTAEIYFSDNDELFYEIGTDKFIYVFKYGVVCFLNHSEVEMSGFLQLISPYCRNPLKERLSDEFDIETEAPKMHLGFNKVSIAEHDTEMLRLIMMHVSQSVALDHFENLTNKLLEETNSHTQVLEIKGKLDLSGLNLKRYIGKTLNLKNRIAENLYIFDSPEETWEDEKLSKLDLGLKKTFDLQSRFRTIEEGLAIVKENLELFKDLLQYRQSMTLEWVIIILIAVEVINLFVEKFLGK